MRFFFAKLKKRTFSSKKKVIGFPRKNKIRANPSIYRDDYDNCTSLKEDMVPQNFLARRTVPIIGNIHLSIIGFARILFLRGNHITFFFDEKVRFFNFAKKKTHPNLQAEIQKSAFFS